MSRRRKPIQLDDLHVGLRVVVHVREHVPLIEPDGCTRLSVNVVRGRLVDIDWKRSPVLLWIEDEGKTWAAVVQWPDVVGCWRER